MNATSADPHDSSLLPLRYFASGAILLKPTDQDHGGRSNSALDPEGHVGSYGSYNPWAE